MEQNSSQIVNDIKDKLTKSLKIENLEITDQSANCGDKISLLIICDEFDGMSLVERHRKIYEILEEEMKQIHSLSLKTYTYKEHQRKLEKK